MRKNLQLLATSTELQILDKLKACSCLPGSFDKKFPGNVDVLNVSPLQQWWIYKLGYKYRKQINNTVLAITCKKFIDSNEKPLSKKEAAKVLTKTASPPA